MIEQIRSHKVFVYGTLKTGHHNHRLLGNAKTEPATLNGAQLRRSSALPYIRLGHNNSVVHGELVHLSDVDALDRLDSLEGYWPEDPDASHYVRVSVTVSTADGEQHQAWAYQAGPRVDFADLVLIVDGNWKRA